MQLNVSNMLAISWVGTLFDLGTATFDIINLTIGNRWISDPGTTIISGLASNGNLTAGGRGIVDGNLFNGTGTALNGIDTADVKWDFKNNVFADNTTINSLVAADVFLTSSRTVTINTIGVYEPIAGADWSSSIASRFTTDTAGIVTYTGLSTIGVSIGSPSTVEKVGGGADKICTKIAIDTGSGFAVQDKSLGCTENATPTGVISAGFFTISTGDKIQLFTANLDTTANVIVSESTVLIEELF